MNFVMPAYWEHGSLLLMSAAVVIAIKEFHTQCGCINILQLNSGQFHGLVMLDVVTILCGELFLRMPIAYPQNTVLYRGDEEKYG
jgi:hypothetical protein